MTIESIIAAYLASYSDLEGIHNGQCQQGMAKQSWTAPYQTVFLISNPPDMRRLGTPSPRLQIDSYATSYGTAQNMANLVFKALDGLDGELQGITIKQCICDEITNDYEDDTNLFKASLDVIIIYKE